MTKRDQWRAKAARYLRWHRAARQSHNMLDALIYFEWYREARGYADYWERRGEQARAPRWYYPDMHRLYPTANGMALLT